MTDELWFSYRTIFFLLLFLFFLIPYTLLNFGTCELDTAATTDDSLLKYMLKVNNEAPKGVYKVIIINV